MGCPDMNKMSKEELLELLANNYDVLGCEVADDDDCTPQELAEWVCGDFVMEEPHSCLPIEGMETKEKFLNWVSEQFDTIKLEDFDFVVPTDYQLMVMVCYEFLGLDYDVMEVLK